MIPLLFASYTTYGDIPEGYTVEDLEQGFDNLFGNLADYVYGVDYGLPDYFNTFPKDLKGLFEYAAGNPLCVAFIVVLLVVMAFRFCPFIFRSFRR